jgi:hypothetical protein
MDTRRNTRSAALGGRRGITLLVAATLALALGATGVRAALGGRSSSRATVAPSPAAESTGLGHPGLPAHRERPSVTLEPAPDVEQVPDPNVLADGVYPAFVNAVDVRGATVTVNLIQVFDGPAATQAAIEDGMSRQDAQYVHIHVRDENDLLRTLPVAGDVRITFIGQCTEPDRSLGLTQLKQEITPFTATYYYAISVVGGRVDGIDQRVAIDGC